MWPDLGALGKNIKSGFVQNVRQAGRAIKNAYKNLKAPGEPIELTTQIASLTTANSTGMDEEHAGFDFMFLNILVPCVLTSLVVIFIGATLVIRKMKQNLKNKRAAKALDGQDWKLNKQAAAAALLEALKRKMKNKSQKKRKATDVNNQEGEQPLPPLEEEAKSKENAADDARRNVDKSSTDKV